MRGKAPGRRSDQALLRLASSYRSKPPLETLRIAEGLMPALGISRVTDITRMDRLGLPVFASVRPRSRTLRVNAGKGVHPLEARVGALMEAIEYAAAEPQNSEWAKASMPVVDLVAQFDKGVHLVDFVPKLGIPISPEQIVSTVECEDICGRKTVQLPAELVFFPYKVEGEEEIFGSTTNGLASGNSLEEATLHAVLEVMERDALSMNKPDDASQWVDCEDLPEHFRTLASSWRGLGVELGVRYVPNAFALPCFEAGLHEPGSDSVNLAAGSGLHVDREIALARAICEAAQSRLSHIHGGRDDITKFYAKYTDMAPSARGDADAKAVRSMFQRDRRIELAAVPHEASRRRSLSAVLDDVLKRLSRSGFESVFRHRFRLDLNGLHVVKVIVPKCEDVEDNATRIGPRLLARILRDA